MEFLLGESLCWARFVCCGFVTCAELFVGPDSQTQEGVPNRTVTKHVLAARVFYPGTPHNYAVYVPAQYDAKKPTAFMVFLEGTGGGAIMPDALRRLWRGYPEPILVRELPQMKEVGWDPRGRCIRRCRLTSRGSRWVEVTGRL
jgi:hypothetical protein